jgi:hypothetical protein
LQVCNVGCGIEAGVMSGDGSFEIRSRHEADDLMPIAGDILTIFVALKEFAAHFKEVIGRRGVLV